MIKQDNNEKNNSNNKKQKEMKETILTYKRGEITYTLCVFSGVFTKLVRRKIKTEHLKEYEAILSVIQDLIASLTQVDSFSFEFIDKEGIKHIISGKVTK